MTWRVVEVADGGARTRKVRFMCAGRGDPLVFLHGWGLTPRAYAPGLLGLPPAGLAIFAPELPGFGQSSTLAVRQRTLRGYAHHIGSALDQLHLGKPAFLVGHSLGGGIAIALARQRPDLIRSLTVLNSVGGTPGWRGLARGSWLSWALAALDELHPNELGKLAPLLLRDLVPNLTRHPATAVLTAGAALATSLAEEAAALVDSGLPVLFIWGDRDRLIAPGVLGAVAGNLPPQVVTGSHGWLMSSPERFAELLRNSLTVHAMLERSARGQALVLPAGATLADLFPEERRHRARHPGGSP